MLTFPAPSLDSGGASLWPMAGLASSAGLAGRVGGLGRMEVTASRKEIPLLRTEDASLAERIREGDQEALAELYDRLGGVVNGIARRFVGESSAEEIVQDTFDRVWRRASTYSAARGSLSAWVLRIARNLTVDELRRRRSRPATSQLAWEELEEFSDPPAIPPHDQVWLGDVRQAVRGACASLPNDQRDVLTLAYFGGLTQSEIAAELGIPLGTVKTRTRAALWKLREMLALRQLLD